MISLAKSAQVLNISRPKLNRILVAEKIRTTPVGNRKCLSKEQISAISEMLKEYARSETEQNEFQFVSDHRSEQKQVSSVGVDQSLISSMESRISDLKDLLKEEKEDRRLMEERMGKQMENFQSIVMVMQQENKDLRKSLLEMQVPSTAYDADYRRQETKGWGDTISGIFKRKMG